VEHVEEGVMEEVVMEEVEEEEEVRRDTAIVIGIAPAMNRCVASTTTVNMPDTDQDLGLGIQRRGVVAVVVAAAGDAALVVVEAAPAADTPGVAVAEDAVPVDAVEAVIVAVTLGAVAGVDLVGAEVDTMAEVQVEEEAEAEVEVPVGLMLTAPGSLQTAASLDTADRPATTTLALEGLEEGEVEMAADMAATAAEEIAAEGVAVIVVESVLEAEAAEIMAEAADMRIRPADVGAAGAGGGRSVLHFSL